MGHRHQEHSDDDAERRPDIGEQMLVVCGQRDPAVRRAGPQEEYAHGSGDWRGHRGGRRPQPDAVQRCGMPKALHRGDQMKPSATKIISPSTPAAKYCALPWPKLWFSWGGRAARSEE